MSKKKIEEIADKYAKLHSALEMQFKMKVIDNKTFTSSRSALYTQETEEVLAIYPR